MIQGNPLYRKYIKNDESAFSLFACPLYPDWHKIINSVLEKYNGRIFLDILAGQNKDIQNKKYLNLLKEKNTVAIVTGQQLGLLVSPMYTVYKILTALLFTKNLSEENKEFNFVPVFWLEGEDHDFAEINHTYYFTKEGDLSEAVYPEQDPEAGLSISKRTLSDEIQKLIHALQEEFQDTEFSDGLFNDLQTIWQTGRKWHKAFSDQIRLIFEDTGLLIFNPADEKVKQHSIPFFKHLIENNDTVVKAFVEQSRISKDAGFENQVVVDSDKAYIFLSYQDGRRIALEKDNSGRFAAKDADINWSKEELLNELQQNSSWFSSTVLTRPIWQSWMLPVISYVAGPAEIAYWAQLKQGFESFNVQMPHVLPRYSFTLLEPKIQRLLKKYSIETDGINSDKDKFIREQLKKAQPPELENAFKKTTKQLAESQTSFEDITEKIDPTLKSVVGKTFGNIDKTLGKMHNKLLKRLEDKEALLVRHFEEIHRNVYPAGKPQERVICSVYYMNKYGPDWLNTLKNQIKNDNFDRQVILL